MTHSRRQDFGYMRGKLINRFCRRTRSRLSVARVTLRARTHGVMRRSDRRRCRLTRAGWRAAGGCAGRTGGESCLLGRREREYVARQQLRVIALIVVEIIVVYVEGEDPTVAVLLKEARRHRRARDDALRIEQPTERPTGLQARRGLQEVGRGRVLVVLRVAGQMTLQTRRLLRSKDRTRHVALLIRQRLKLLLHVRLLFGCHSHEEADERAQLVRREV